MIFVTYTAPNGGERGVFSNPLSFAEFAALPFVRRFGRLPDAYEAHGVSEADLAAETPTVRHLRSLPDLTTLFGLPADLGRYLEAEEIREEIRLVCVADGHPLRPRFLPGPRRCACGSKIEEKEPCN